LNLVQRLTASFWTALRQELTQLLLLLFCCDVRCRCERFHLVKKYEVEFNKAAISLADQMTNPHQKKATMNRLLKVRHSSQCTMQRC
jgi:CCR4-NOT transcription complex subunit 6